MASNFQTVSELTDAIKFTLNSDYADVWVTGEISGITCPRSGHIYFSLKDPEAQISAVIWRSSVARMNFKPEDGMQVLCRGYVDVYPQRGNYQLIIRVIQPIGEGNLRIAFRQLHERLRGEGLFEPEHKVPLPQIPKRVVLITSPTGAAIRDFLSVVNRRWPQLEILIVPVQVQGSQAAGQIAEAIKTFGRSNGPFSPDVLVVTRGGGSIEDLWAFNEEVVVRAIFAAKVPVVSAVGHEIDVTLSDLVADIRALTPTEAGEKLVPSRLELVEALRSSQVRLSNSMDHKFRNCQAALQQISRRRSIRQPLDHIHRHSVLVDALEARLLTNSKRQFEVAKQKLDSHFERLRTSLRTLAPRFRSQLDALARSKVIQEPLTTVHHHRGEIKSMEQRLRLAIAALIEKKTNSTKLAAAKLRAFNPKNVLQRGFSLTVDKNGTPIADCQTLSSGDTIETWLGIGKVTSTVERIQIDAELLSNGEEKEKRKGN